MAVDQSLTNSLKIARQNWADDFDETYLSAQPWLFTSQQAAAIIIPSIDKVGRKFPLYLAVLKGIVLQFLYDAAIAAITHGRDADDLLTTLAGAPMREAPSPLEPEGHWFCIDPEAPSLPRCWDEASFALGGEVT